MATDMLEINEIFGPTIQGEGHSAGQHCLFIRTFQCNLECTWCDTAKTWAITPEKAAKTQSGKRFFVEEQRRLMAPADVIGVLDGHWNVKEKPTLIVISGGEPMMQARKLYPVTRQLFDWHNRIHIETAGTIKTFPELDVTVEQYNVSPKLAHSGNPYTKRYKPDALINLMGTGKARFKFVVRSPLDFPEIDYIVADLSIPKHHVMIMPEGNSADMNILAARDLIQDTLERGYGWSFRSHVLIWEDKEGV